MMSSSEAPDEEADVVAVEQYAGFAFVVEIGAEVDSADHVPAAFELFLETFLDVLRCVFEVGHFVFDHLHVDVFRDHEGVLAHVHFHVAEFDVGGDLDVGGDPVFGDACSCHFLLLVFGLLVFVLLLFGRHKVQLLFKNETIR
jgi:hypothetical protein